MRKGNLRRVIFGSRFASAAFFTILILLRGNGINVHYFFIPDLDSSSNKWYTL